MFYVLFCIELRFLLSDLRSILKEQSEGSKYNINWLLYKVSNSVPPFQPDFKGLSIKMEVGGKNFASIQTKFISFSTETFVCSPLGGCK